MSKFDIDLSLMSIVMTFENKLVKKSDYQFEFF